MPCEWLYSMPMNSKIMASFGHSGNKDSKLLLLCNVLDCFYVTDGDLRMRIGANDILTVRLERFGGLHIVVVKEWCLCRFKEAYY